MGKNNQKNIKSDLSENCLEMTPTTRDGKKRKRGTMTLKELLKQLNSIPKRHLNTDVRVSVDALIDEGYTENFWFTDVEVREPQSGLDRPEIIISGSE